MVKTDNETVLKKQTVDGTDTTILIEIAKLIENESLGDYYTRAMALFQGVQKAVDEKNTELCNLIKSQGGDYTIDNQYKEVSFTFPTQQEDDDFVADYYTPYLNEVLLVDVLYGVFDVTFTAQQESFITDFMSAGTDQMDILQILEAERKVHTYNSRTIIVPLGDWNLSSQPSFDDTPILIDGNVAFDGFDWNLILSIDQKTCHAPFTPTNGVPIVDPNTFQYRTCYGTPVGVLTPINDTEAILNLDTMLFWDATGDTDQDWAVRS